MIRAKAIHSGLTRQAYWLVALVPLLMPLGWALRTLPGMGIAFAWFTLVILYGVLPIADLVIGRDISDPDVNRQCVYTDTIIPLVACLSYTVVLAWALLTLAVQPEAFPPLALLGWTLSLANLGGIVAINVSHELIHKRSRYLQALGGVMLSLVSYACFKLEHPRWHHVHVATPNDPSSAPRGSTVYSRAPRAWLLNTVRGFQLGHEAARKAGRILPALLNEMVLWYGLSAAFAAAVYFLLGSTALMVFIAQGLGAAMILELINYVEHYGLRRETRPDGRYEPPRVSHSWDSDFWLSSALLLQLPRHSDHHIHPSRPYGALQRHSDAPQLPLGYASLIMVALLPPLWSSLIDPKLGSRNSPESG